MEEVEGPPFSLNQGDNFGAHPHSLVRPPLPRAPAPARRAALEVTPKPPLIMTLLTQSVRRTAGARRGE